jgi:hypothetical protein
VDDADSDDLVVDLVEDPVATDPEPEEAALPHGDAASGRGSPARSSTASNTAASPSGSSTMKAWGAVNAPSAQTVW